MVTDISPLLHKVALILVLLLSVSSTVFAQQSEVPILCESEEITSHVGDVYINSYSLYFAEDGRGMYLTNSRADDFLSVFRIDPDSKITEVGHISDEVLGVYGSPQWQVNIETGNFVFAIYPNGDYTKGTTIFVFDLETGEITELMGGVNESSFGYIDEQVWWTSSVVADSSDDYDYGFYLYDPETDVTATILVPNLLDEDDQAYIGRLVEALPNGDIIFIVGRFLSGRMTSIATYRGSTSDGIAELISKKRVENSSVYFFPDDDVDIPEEVLMEDVFLQFIDPEQEIAYYFLDLPPGENEDYILYATTFGNRDDVRVNMPNVDVPFDMHSYSFFLTPDNHVIYLGDMWQSLYRTRCERTD